MCGICVCMGCVYMGCVRVWGVYVWYMCVCVYVSALWVVWGARCVSLVSGGALGGGRPRPGVWRVLSRGAVWWVGAERRLRRCQGWRLMKGIGASVWGSSSSCHAHVHF